MHNLTARQLSMGVVKSFHRYSSFQSAPFPPPPLALRDMILEVDVRVKEGGREDRRRVVVFILFVLLFAFDDEEEDLR